MKEKMGTENNMTSTYDNLAYLFHLIKEHSEFKQLVDMIYDYVIEEINKVNPNILHWDTWRQNKYHSLEFYANLYGIENAKLHQKVEFISDAHSKLDHDNRYHLKTIHNYLDLIIGYVADWFYKQPKRDGGFSFYGIHQFDWRIRKKYFKIFRILKPMLLKIMDDKDYNKSVVKRWKEY